MPVKVICATCQKEFFRKPSWAKYAKYCSRKCKNLNLVGHIPYNKGKPGPRGENAAHWRGGRRTHSGYIEIYSPNHPYKTANKTVKEHRLVIEKHLGRFLKPNEKVHHINNIRDDNRIENLKLISNHSEHMKNNHRNILHNYHQSLKPFDITKFRQCTYCKKVFPLSAEYFHRAKNLSYGFHYGCKKCRSLRRVQ